MVEKIVQHKHCQICGKAIPLKEKFCSEECEQKFNEIVKKRKILIYILYGAVVLMILALTLPYMIK